MEKGGISGVLLRTFMAYVFILDKMVFQPAITCSKLTIESL